MKQTLLIFLGCMLPALNLAAKKRLVAQSHYERLNQQSLVRTDSARYAYTSTTRGSRFDANNLWYADFYGIRYGFRTLNEQEEYQIGTRNNIDSSNLAHILADTTWHLRTWPQNGFTDQTTVTLFRQYGSSNEIASTKTVFNNQYQSYPLDSGSTVTNTYTAGKLVQSTVYVPADSLSIYQAWRSLQYDGLGRLVVDSTHSKAGVMSNRGFATRYTYAGSSDRYATRRTWDYTANGEATFDSSFYDAAGRVVKTYHRDHSIGWSAPSYSYTDSFGYSTGVSGHTFMKRDATKATNPNPYWYTATAVRINGRGQKDSVVFAGTAYSGVTVAISYDADGDPVSRREYAPNSTTQQQELYSMEYYSYQSFTPAAISTIGGHSAISATVFPVPVADNLNIRFQGLDKATRMTIAISDQTGRLVRTEAALMTADTYRMQLGTDIAPGAYLIRITDSQGALVHSGKITRR
jgi:hypothetical protein